VKQVVLVFLRRNQEVLLGKKKTGFGQGKIVTVGGHIETGETPAQAAARECLEETSVTVLALTLVARVEFVFLPKPEWNMHATVFECLAWQGQPLESEELAPVWFDPAALPLTQMWDDGRYWVRQVLQGARFDARMVYGNDLQTVQDAHLEPWVVNVQNRTTSQKNGLE
jgi:8-oxo-dGTP diphosphatase